MIELIGCILLAIIGILLICTIIDELRTNYRMRKDIERKMEINNDDDLNIEYICNKTLLDKNDELVPIILDIINESYKAGLCQAEFDNTMNLIEENQELKKQLYELGGVDEFNKHLLTQQKEFILYLRHLSNWYSADGVKQGMVNEILQKYKEIIGVSDDNKTTI